MKFGNIHGINLVMQMQIMSPGHPATGANFLGVDVSVGLIDQANTWTVRSGLAGRLQFLAADISSVLSQLHSYPGPVRAVAVQVGCERSFSVLG